MSFQKSMWWVAGANPEILKKCPTDYSKFASIGIMITVTALVAVFSGTFAAWYFMSDSEGSGSLFAAFLFGLGWAGLIFSIDRCLVITLAVLYPCYAGPPDRPGGCPGKAHHPHGF